MSAKEPEIHNRLVVRAAWLFDGTSATLLPQPTVIVEGERITAVESGGEPPGDGEVVDLGDATLLPGLVDTHVHLALDATADPVGNLAKRDDEQTLVAMTDAARIAARGGVTTVRDLGDRGYLSLQLAQQPGLPTVVAAGPPITTTGGHCHFLGGAADPGPDGMRTAVREHVDRGVDVIKIMASGGFLTPGTREDQSQFNIDELRAAIEEAHRHGLPVTAHVHGTDAIVDSIAAGIDGLEHASFMTPEGIEEASEEVVTEIVERRIAIGATAGFAPSDTELDPDAARHIPGIISNMVRLMQAGAVVLPGTDAGVHPTKPHDAVRYGVEQLVQLGMPPLQGLMSATSTGAEVCGLGHRKGRIAPGYDADILAIDGNPLTDTSALHSIREVWIRGTRVPR
jgi:imidazolonepropionase-like amidohydrolase